MRFSLISKQEVDPLASSNTAQFVSTRTNQTYRLLIITKLKVICFVSEVTMAIVPFLKKSRLA